MVADIYFTKELIYILQDIEMYDEVSNTPANARTSNLNEELGQVSYIQHLNVETELDVVSHQL